MMEMTITLEQAKQMAVQLPPSEQLVLVEYISEQLRSLFQSVPALNVESKRQERESDAEALLTELDAIAESIEGKFDSAADLRQLRSE